MPENHINLKRTKNASKFLSLLLRHKPETIGLVLDKNGWAIIDEIIEKSGKKGRALTRQLIDAAVAENNKKRFAISEDGLKIRARQGHSIKVDVELKEMVPPAELYHGTADKNMTSILNSGLNSGKRLHVHLSQDVETAKSVGQRHGKPVVFKVAADKMHQAGIKFYLSENDVWLVETVPPAFLAAL